MRGNEWRVGMANDKGEIRIIRGNQGREGRGNEVRESRRNKGRGSERK